MDTANQHVCVVHAVDGSLKECIQRMRYDNKDNRISIREKFSSTQALFNLVPPLNSKSGALVTTSIYSFPTVPDLRKSFG